MMNQMKCIRDHMETARLAGRMHVIMNSLQNKLKESGGKASPKDALTSILDKSGGFLYARSVGSIPKSRSQVRYH